MMIPVNYESMLLNLTGSEKGRRWGVKCCNVHCTKQQPVAFRLSKIKGENRESRMLCMRKNYLKFDEANSVTCSYKSHRISHRIW